MRFLIIALVLLSRPRFVTDMYPTADIVTEVNREADAVTFTEARPHFAAALYPTAGIVTEVDYSTDTVTFTDSTGNTWSFSGTEDWMLGDGCAAIMDGRGTDTIYDDTIVAVRYCG